MFKKSTQRTQRIQSQTNHVQQIPMMFNLNMRPAPVNITPSVLVEPKKVDTSATMTWGKPIWYFLHCLAANIDETVFSSKRTDLLKVVYLICTNLPCHICSDHAKGYLDSINFNNIKTKQNLIQQLYLFHNSVNARKGFPMFSESSLKKYEDVHMQRVIIDFLRAYSNSNKLNIHSFSRQSTINYVRGWLNANYNNL